MWWGQHGFHPGWVFVMLLAGLLIFRIVAFRRNARWCRGWRGGRFDAEAILRRRLANGEISETEYQHLKEILSK